MDNTEFIQAPAGNAIRLSSIYDVSRITQSAGYKGNPDRDACYFNVTYGPKGDTAQFYYTYSDYVEDRDTLLKKIENIRMNILKLMNNGIEVKPINSTINMVKKDGK